MPKPEGFFDPAAPAGRGQTPESQQTNANGGRQNAPATPATPPGHAAAVRSGRVESSRLHQLDLAFSGNHVIVGSYHGFNTYDVERPNRPKLLASIVCPGGQGDVSVHGNLLFMSVEQTRGRLDCGTQGVPTAVSAERFRGIRIFDISDVNKPKQLGGDPDVPRLAHAHAGHRS